jgi:hypothetical protein
MSCRHYCHPVIGRASDSDDRSELDIEQYRTTLNVSILTYYDGVNTSLYIDTYIEQKNNHLGG